jgi:cytoskeletal protein CcmA (bactofilin family)
VEIRGQVEGVVRLDAHHLVVADTGQLIAEISARTVLVSGQVVGNVTATERIVVGSGGCVLGDLCAPSIQLEDGSRFTGGINKQSEPAKVTGWLYSDDGEESPRSEIEKSVAHARREGLYDQAGRPEPRESASGD